MQVIGRDNNKNKVRLEDRTVVLMTDEELAEALSPGQEKTVAKQIEEAPETKDIKGPEVSKTKKK